MNVKFFSPNGESWDMSPNLTDRSGLYTTSVRRYFYGGAHYTVLACIDYNNPHKVFYNLEVKRPEGVNVPASQERDFKILHNLMTEFPIPKSHYEKSEKKLEYKVSQLKVEEWKQERQGMTEDILRKMDRRTNNCLDRESDALIAELEAERFKRIAAREQRKLLPRPTARADWTNTTEQRSVDMTVALYRPRVSLPSLNDVQLIAALLNTLSRCSGDIARLLKKETCMYTPWATHQPMIGGPQQRSIPISDSDLLVIQYILQAARCLYRLLRSQIGIENVSMTTNIRSTYPVAYIKPCKGNELVPYPIPCDTSNVKKLHNTNLCYTTKIATEFILDRNTLLSSKYLGINVAVRGLTSKCILQDSAFNIQAAPRNIASEDVLTSTDLRTHDSMPRYRLPTINSCKITENINTYNVADAADVDDDVVDVAADDDDDYDGLFGGILGVFARSSIHGDYSGIVGQVDERKIC